MRRFDRNRNENSDSESGNENGLCNGCSNRSLYSLFRVISEEDFQEENIYNIDLFLVYSGNSSDGSDGISGKWNRRYRQLFSGYQSYYRSKKRVSEKYRNKNGADERAYA